MDEDIKIDPVNMAQTMSIMATAVHAMITQAFIKSEDSDEDKTKLTYVCIAVFLNQFCCSAKHKTTMANVLKAVIMELEHEEGTKDA